MLAIVGYYNREKLKEAYQAVRAAWGKSGSNDKDAQAKDNLRLIQAALERYAGDHEGRYPPSLDDLITKGYIAPPMNPYFSPPQPVRLINWSENLLSFGEFQPGGIVYIPQDVLWYQYRLDGLPIGYDLLVYGERAGEGLDVMGDERPDGFLFHLQGGQKEDTLQSLLSWLEAYKQGRISLQRSLNHGDYRAGVREAIRQRKEIQAGVWACQISAGKNTAIGELASELESILTDAILALEDFQATWDRQALRSRSAALEARVASLERRLKTYQGGDVR